MICRVMPIFVLFFVTTMTYGTLENDEGFLHLWSGNLGGLNNLQLTQNINENEFQKLECVFTDREAGVQVCDGVKSVWLTTGTVRFMKEYTKSTGERYLMFVSSSYLNYAKTPTNYTTLLSTLSMTTTIWGEMYNNYFYLGSYDTDRYYFDGTTLVQSTEIPKGKYSCVAYGKLFIANINTAGGGSRVEYSDIDNFELFPDDYYFLINKDDGESIRGIKLFMGNVYIFKDHSMYMLTKIDDDTNEGDNWVTITKEIGCVSNSSIVELNNKLYWLSQSGIISFDGSSFQILSSVINNTIDNIKELKSLNSYWVETSSNDFASSEYSINIATSFPGSIGISDVFVSSRVDQQNNSGASEDTSQTKYQSFVSSTTGFLRQLRLKLEGYFTIGICIGDSTGVAITSTKTVTASLDPERFVDINFDETNIILSSGTTYRIVSSYSSGESIWHYNTSNVYNRGARNGVAGNGDFVFEVWVTTYPEYFSEKREITNINETWKSWENFSVEGSSLSMVDFYVRTATNTAFQGNYSWIKIDNFSTISSTVGSTIDYKIIFKSKQAKVDSVTIGYSIVGNAEILSSVSQIKENRVWWGCTDVRTGNNNDLIIIRQEDNKSFTTIKGLNITAMCNYKYEVYLGGLTGNIYRYSSDYTDFNGTSIEPVIQTKDFYMSEFSREARLIDKEFEELWVVFEPTEVFDQATIEYYVNKSTEAYESATVNLSAIGGWASNPIVEKLNSTLDRFRYINFKIKDFYKFNGLDFIFKLNERGDR